MRSTTSSRARNRGRGWRPPLVYVTECRMDGAEALLSDTDLAIAQIAEYVGYADAFGFRAAFKRHRGLSPSVFRAAAA